MTSSQQSKLTCVKYQNNKNFDADRVEQTYLNELTTIGNICIKVVPHVKIAKAKADKKEYIPNAFCSSIKYDQPKIYTQQEFKEFLESDESKTSDFAEVLRIDQSRLFFDIDCHSFDELNVLIAALQIIEKIATLTKTQVIGLIEYRNELDIDDYYELYEIINNDTFETVIKIKTNVSSAKLLSGHLYLKGKYFNRSDSTKFFKQLAQIFKAYPELSKLFDTSVYKEGQQVFRHPYSSKMIVERKANQQIHELENYIEGIEFTVSPSKTDKFESGILLDRVFKTMTKEEENVYGCEDYKVYLQKPIENPKHINKTENINNSLSGFESIDFSDTVDPVKTQGEFNNWYKSLCVYAAYLRKYNNKTEDEILEILTSGEYNYIHSTGEQDVDGPYNSIKSAVEYGFNNCDKYSLPTNKIYRQYNQILRDREEVCELLGKYIFTWNEVINLINSAFAFTKDCVVYKSEGKKEIVPLIKLTNYRDTKIKILDNISEEPRYNVYSLTMLLKELPIHLINYYKNIVCCEKDKTNLFNMYDLPTTTNTPVYELDERLEKIFDLWAYDEDDNDRMQRRKKYILQWLAYVLQHPEENNTVALCISSLEGIGKSTITKILKKFMESFCVDNADITKYLQQFNGARRNKKLICFNEVKAGKDMHDKIKSLITEETFDCELKGLETKTDMIDKSSKLMFSNHMDMDLTDTPSSRRFMYFITTAKPLSKEFYDSLYNGRELKTEIIDNLINYLLTLDLSDYSPYTKVSELSDDKIIEDLRNSTKHPLIQLLNKLFKSDEIETFKNNSYVLYNDVKDLVQDYEEKVKSEDIKEFIEIYYNEIINALKPASFNRVCQNNGFVKDKSNFRDKNKDKQIIKRTK